MKSATIAAQGKHKVKPQETPFPKELWEEITEAFARWEEKRLSGCIEISTHWKNGRMLKAHVVPKPAVKFELSSAT